MRLHTFKGYSIWKTCNPIKYRLQTQYSLLISVGKRIYEAHASGPLKAKGGQHLRYSKACLTASLCTRYAVFFPSFLSQFWPNLICSPLNLFFLSLLPFSFGDSWWWWGKWGKKDLEESTVISYCCLWASKLKQVLSLSPSSPHTLGLQQSAFFPLICLECTYE